MTNNDNDMDRRKDSWHLSKSIPISFIAALVGQTLAFVWWASTMASQIQHNTDTIDAHVLNKVDHMPYSEKITVFVPRVELDSRFQSIDKNLDEIKQLIRDRQ